MNLPPLNALRAFEVAARCGSFVEAGEELGVTAAAVSQQVRNLEGFLAKRLFFRQGNRITLTDAGRAVYPRLEQAFSDIAALSGAIRDGQKRARLVVSVMPSLADLWLLPRLRDFGGDTGIEIRVEEDPVAFSREGVDLRVTYGASYYPDHQVEVLFADRVVAVATPDFAQGMVGGIDGLPDRDFIHTDWGPTYATQPTWANWLARARSVRFVDPAAGLRVPLTSLAIAAAREGLGVALAPEKLAGRDLAAGRLLVVDPASMPMPSEYVLIYPQALARRRPLQALVAHLKGESVT
jgi:LysR family transcriptional regulator, glycine cleavage system transcriptional activator